MKINRIISKNNCSICNNSIGFKIDRPLEQNILPLMVNAGFTTKDNFTKAGILCIENNWIMVLGKFGSNYIQTKCKKTGCEDKINEFEQLLLQME